MTLLNIESIALDNREIACMINDLCYILYKHNDKLYNHIVLEKLVSHKLPDINSEKVYLTDLCNYILIKLGEILHLKSHT